MSFYKKPSTKPGGDLPEEAAERPDADASRDEERTVSEEAQSVRYSKEQPPSHGAPTVTSGHPSHVLEEIDEGQEQVFDDRDWTAELHAAARSNDALKVRLLLSSDHPSRRIDVDIPNAKGETALVMAAQEGAAASCAALLDGKADPLCRDNHAHYFGDAVWPNEKNPSKFGTRSPACVWAMNGKTPIYQLRLDGKFDAVLSQVFPMTRIALVRAIAAGIQDYHGKSAMIVAANEGNSELTALLLMNSGALPQMPQRAPSTQGWNQPQAAASRMGVLLPPVQGARNSDRGQALVAACSQKEWHTAQVLLAAGVGRASLDNAKAASGQTALHLAAAAGEERVVRRLLDAGASTRIYDEFGRLPLHEAALGSHSSTVKTLLEGRADPRLRSNGIESVGTFGTGKRGGGKTAFDFAASRGNTLICTLLRECGGDMGSPTGAGFA